MTKTNKDILSLIAILAFAVLIAVLGPFAIIWSLNTLFPVLAIPYTFYSWLAVAALNVFWKTTISFKKD